MSDASLRLVRRMIEAAFSDRATHGVVLAITSVLSLVCLMLFGWLGYRTATAVAPVDALWGATLFAVIACVTARMARRRWVALLRG